MLSDGFGQDPVHAWKFARFLADDAQRRWMASGDPGEYRAYRAALDDMREKWQRLTMTDCATR